MDQTIAVLQEFLLTPEASEEPPPEQTQIDIKKLEERINYYNWLNGIIVNFESKEFLNYYQSK